MNTSTVGPSHAFLPERGILAVSGVDAAKFLQGLITNDVAKVTDAQVIYAALLTAQGKFLHDFFVSLWQDAFLLDCERGRLDDLKRRLSIYRLRSQVTLEDHTSALSVAAVFGEGALAALGLDSMDRGGKARFGDGFVCVDPRSSALGARAYLPPSAIMATLKNVGLCRRDAQAYDALRGSLGVPDGSRDMQVEKSILLENRIDEFNGIDWDKGCYMGQELTARTRYRALVKKKLMPVRVEGPLPPCGTAIMQGERLAGELRSGAGNCALALLRLDVLESDASGDAQLTAAGVKLAPQPLSR